MIHASPGTPASSLGTSVTLSNVNRTVLLLSSAPVRVIPLSLTKAKSSLFPANALELCALSPVHCLSDPLHARSLTTLPRRTPASVFALGVPTSRMPLTPISPPHSIMSIWLISLLLMALYKCHFPWLLSDISSLLYFFLSVYLLFLILYIFFFKICLYHYSMRPIRPMIYLHSCYGQPRTDSPCKYVRYIYNWMTQRLQSSKLSLLLQLLLITTAYSHKAKGQLLLLAGLLHCFSALQISSRHQHFAETFLLLLRLPQNAVQISKARTKSYCKYLLCCLSPTLP